MADRDGRNFRSFYYDTLGLKNVEQKKALEILLKDEEIDVDRVATFSCKFSLPAVFRPHVWKILLGILSPYQAAHSYMTQQRTEQFHDLKKALIVINQIDSQNADLGELITKMYLMQEGGYRVNTVSEELKTQVRILHAVVNVFADMFEDEVDLYWLSIKFVQIQKQFINQWETLLKIIEHYIQTEDNSLWRHLQSLNAFEHLPYKRWFESSFSEDLPDSCMERIWDKVVAGSSRILGIVGVALLIVYRHQLLSIKESQAFLQVFNKPCPENACVIVASKAMELWDKHGSTINSEPLQVKPTQGS
ncbi:TBC1 domain family member 7 [Exaiptasia diaphana]|uniref:TBC1 domain family member 7 n=1 Tax=Exaiptasia diaphana TaxID=2652724 RepID=A0A913XH17_EXADI|nr:TBC1 domain family member 7 [Exaiptasia diaphana]KXJ12188.1 TBC1 domain family member 7 [Exaiptasia diaphana]